MPFETYAANQTGLAEDVQDEIYIISPIDNPIASMSRSIRATAKTHEWLTDSLSTPKQNAQPEGAEAGADTSTVKLTRDNYTQIMSEVAEITGTLEDVDKYGRDSEMAYQLELRYGDLANDEEVAIAGRFNTAFQAKAIGTIGAPTGGARLMASLGNQINAVDGGTNGTVEDATGLTTYAAVEEKLLNVHEKVYVAGGNPTYLVVPPQISRVISYFALSSGRTRDIRNERRLVNVIDLYVSNFGELDVVLDRNMVDVTTATGATAQTNDMFVLDFNYLATPVLRSTRDWPIAKTGDTDKRQILRESTFAVLADLANGLVENVPTTGLS